MESKPGEAEAVKDASLAPTKKENEHPASKPADPAQTASTSVPDPEEDDLDDLDGTYPLLSLIQSY
jgi:hypothetical protein